MKPLTPLQYWALVAQDTLWLWIVAPLVCKLKGHLWDYDRVSGPLHERDICWRCPAVREYRCKLEGE